MRQTGIFLFLLLLTVACNKNNKGIDAEVIFSDNQGNIIKKSDLKDVSGQINYKVMSNQKIKEQAIDLHNEARRVGQEGRYDEAILKQKEAISIQPDWAYPPYDLAFTYLLKGDSENALNYYKLTNTLEPKGFFTTKTAIYTLEGEKDGMFPEGTYMAYMQIEWTNDEAEKLEIAQTITNKIPNYGPAWKELANLLEGDDRLNAIEKGLNSNPDDETKGILIINKALFLSNSGKNESAIELLGNYIFSDNVTISNQELAKFVLKSISK